MSEEPRYLTQLCKDLGIPLAVEKIEGPSTSLTFLGITLDTEQMEEHSWTDCMQLPKEMHFYSRLNSEFRYNLMWWYAFVQTWNGLSILHHIPLTDFAIYTDASGKWGCGAIWDIHWLQWQWPNEWDKVGIMCKELVPILLSCAVWSSMLSKKHVYFHCDNLSLAHQKTLL